MLSICYAHYNYCQHPLNIIVALNQATHPECFEVIHGDFVSKKMENGVLEHAAMAVSADQGAVSLDLQYG